VISQAQLKQEVRTLTAKAVEKLSDHELRVLAWKTAALDGPAATTKGGGILSGHVVEEKLAVWRRELLGKLGRRERLVTTIDEAGALLHPAVRGQVDALEAECDHLAELILDAED
jgi:hypothetical protein